MSIQSELKEVFYVQSKNHSNSFCAFTVGGLKNSIKPTNLCMKTVN